MGEHGAGSARLVLEEASGCAQHKVAGRSHDDGLTACTASSRLFPDTPLPSSRSRSLLPSFLTPPRLSGLSQIALLCPR